MSAEVFIPLTQGKVAIIDFDDWDKVRGFKWSAHVFKNNRKIYAFRGASGRNRYLHQELLPGCKSVDHKDGNGLNNCRDNLRPACAATNGRNRRPNQGKRFKGTTKVRNRFRASITHQGKYYNLGLFPTEILAAKVYDTKAKEIFGEFALLNFP